MNANEPVLVRTLQRRRVVLFKLYVKRVPRVCVRVCVCVRVRVCVCVCVTALHTDGAGRAESITDQQGFSHKPELGKAGTLLQC